MKTVGEEIKVKESNGSTMEAPNPAPREKSPGVLKEIDDLKTAIADSQTGIDDFFKKKITLKSLLLIDFLELF